MKVSIITATRNSEKTLQRAIDSIANQDYAKIEHIVVDGASSDKTVEIIRKNGTRIDKYISEKDNGIYDALNKGIALASGDIIGFLNSDDRLANRTTISTIVAHFKEGGSDIVYGDLIYITTGQEHNEDKIIRYWKSNCFDAKDIKKGWMPPHPTVYCRREIYDNFGGYDDTFRIASDYDFLLRVFKQSHLKKNYISQVLVKMSVGGVSNNSVKNIILKSREDLRAIKKNGIGGVCTLLFKNLRKANQLNPITNRKRKC